MEFNCRRGIVDGEVGGQSNPGGNRAWTRSLGGAATRSSPAVAPQVQTSPLLGEKQSPDKSEKESGGPQKDGMDDSLSLCCPVDLVLLTDRRCEEDPMCLEAKLFCGSGIGVVYRSKRATGVGWAGRPLEAHFLAAQLSSRGLIPSACGDSSILSNLVDCGFGPASFPPMMDTFLVSLLSSSLSPDAEPFTPLVVSPPASGRLLGAFRESVRRPSQALLPPPARKAKSRKLQSRVVRQSQRIAHWSKLGRQ